jgi:hypothetical protein
MRVFYVDRVIVRTLEEDGTYTAMSTLDNQIYPDCRFLTPNPDNLTYPRIGKHALLANVDNQNLIIGYYTDEYEDGKYKIYLEGEQIISCGESRAFITGDNGYVGIYHIVRKEDGSIEKTPLIEYDGDDELSAAFSKMVISMATGVYSHSVESDDAGFTHAETAIKGSTRDMGSRYKRTIKATPAGMDITTMVDCSPIPVRTSPDPTPQAIPVRTEIRHNPNNPIKITQHQGPVVVATIETDVSGNLVISCGLTPATKATIRMNVATGAMVVDAPGGLDLKGVSQSLVQVLNDHIVNMYNTHIHTSPVGPTTPPLPLDGVTPVRLTTIKGAAT